MCRIADEYDAAQERGEVADGKGRGPGVSILSENTKSTVTDIGLTSQQVFAARQIRDAEQARPNYSRSVDDGKN
jgi:hypothetical protein